MRNRLVLLAAAALLAVAGYQWWAQRRMAPENDPTELVRIEPVPIPRIPLPDPPAEAAPPDRGLLAPVERGLWERDGLKDGASRLLHTTYLWGPEVCFPGTSERAPVSVLKVVLGVEDHPDFQARPKLGFVDTTGRLRLHSYRLEAFSTKGERHFDQVIAAVADLGVPLSQPLGVTGGEATLRDVFRELLSDYAPETDELEWTAVAIARYLPPETRWRNRWGQRFSIDDVARHLLARPLNEGPCAGTHKVEALCVLLRVDEEYPILDGSTRAAILVRLKEVRDLLEQSQLSTGAWPKRWWISSDELATEWIPDKERWERLLSTGHHLEWIALAPAELRPSEEAIRKAVDWCYEELTSNYDTLHHGMVCPSTHALISVYRFYYRDLMQGSRLPFPDESGQRKAEG